MPVPPKDKWRSQRGTLRGGTRQGRGTEGREKEGSAPLVTGLALDLGSARCYCLRSVWESREVLEVRWDGIRERSTRKAIWIKLGHLPERKLHRFMYLVAVGTELSCLMLTSCHHMLI